MREVEKNPFRLGIRLEDGSNEAAISTANINNFADRREVIAGHNRGINHRAETSHRLVEDAPIFRMLGTVLPHVHAEEVVKGNLSSLDTVEDLPPRGIMILAEFGDGKGAQRAGHVGPQGGGKR